MPVGCTSAEEEIRGHEESRRADGLRPLTALEYDANLRWLRRYRAYPDLGPDIALNEWDEQRTREILEDPKIGSRARAEAILEEIRIAHIDEHRIAARGPDTTWELEPEQKTVCEQLGDWGQVHELHLRVLDRHQQAVVTRGLSRRVGDWFERISAERNDAETPANAIALWDAAYEATAAMSGRISWAMSMLQAEYLEAAYRWREARASVEATRAINAGLRSRACQPSAPTSLVNPFDDHLPGAQSPGQTVEDFSSRFSRSPLQFPSLPRPTPIGHSMIVPGQESLGLIPVDEARYWAESESFTSRDINRLTSLPSTFLGYVRPGPNTRMTDEESYNLHHPGGYSWAEEQARHGRLVEAGQAAFRPSNLEDELDYSPPGASTTSPFQFYRSARIADVDQPALDYITGDGSGDETGPLVRESFEITTEGITNQESSATIQAEDLGLTQDTLNHAPEPGQLDELILRSVRMTGPREGESLRTMVDRDGNVYWVAEALPIDHYLHPEFRAAHERALQVALTEVRLERQNPGYEGQHLITATDPVIPSRTRQGILDDEPRLFPGIVYHELLARRDPDEDNANAPPGFRAQFLANQVEHSGT
ncbi:hypothetical protein C8F04DRAFT_1186135 [Mycena alexandri]|uniref:Uncharacterized protein n=1 Tax=Mycena alexandri TaxID=1745969 RepID=A0AAD6SP04_9AGAR|nr:hypothetical protein C8F04DRAFT_1186135 [Mycena alexandri]